MDPDIDEDYLLNELHGLVGSGDLQKARKFLEVEGHMGYVKRVDSKCQTPLFYAWRSEGHLEIVFDVSMDIKKLP